MRSLVTLFATLVLGLNSQAQFGFGEPSKAQETAVANVETIQPGVPFYAGVRLDIEGGWHTYWKNVGNDISNPTHIDWELPEGFVAGELLFPTPHYEVTDGAPSHVFSGIVYHVAAITPPADLKPGTEINLKGTLKLLVCTEGQCEPPSDRKLSLKLKVADGEPEPSPDAEGIEAMLNDSPLRLPQWDATAKADGDQIIITATAPDGTSIPESGLYFFPDARNLVADGKENQKFEIEGNKLTLTVPKADGFAGEISGLLAAEGGIGTSGGHSVILSTAGAGEGTRATPPSSPGNAASNGAPAGGSTIENLSPAEAAQIREANDQLAARVLKSISTATPIAEERPGADSEASPTTEGAAAAKSSGSAGDSGGSLMLMLGLAFLGGMILNLMPCVFPILGIKIMGFVKQAGEDKAKIRRHGLVFAVGVLISMWLLVAVLVGLKIFYEKNVPWGFQLQNPTFLALMILLMFAFALNLCGLFEIGTSLTGAGADLQQKHGYSGSFFSGVLAVLVATPCTGPFMGPAVGFALTSNPASTFAVFTALALGLALPYVILSYFPFLIQKLPKPGAWMETFKQFMAFPLFGMVIWLVGVFGKISGQTALGYLLFGLLILALALWIYGRFGTPFKPKKTKFTARFAAVAVLVIAGWFTFTAIKVRKETGSFAKAVVKHGVSWEGYDPREIVTALKSGRGVFIDFTADW